MYCNANHQDVYSLTVADPDAPAAAPLAPPGRSTHRAAMHVAVACTTRDNGADIARRSATTVDARLRHRHRHHHRRNRQLAAPAFRTAALAARPSARTARHVRCEWGAAHTHHGTLRRGTRMTTDGHRKRLCARFFLYYFSRLAQGLTGAIMMMLTPCRCTDTRTGWGQVEGGAGAHAAGGRAADCQETSWQGLAAVVCADMKSQRNSMGMTLAMSGQMYAPLRHAWCEVVISEAWAGPWAHTAPPGQHRAAWPARAC